MSSKDDLLKRRADLSSARRALLEQRLRGKVTAHAASDRLLPPLRPIPRDGVLPLTPSQRYLWLVDQKLPRTGYFNTPINMWLAGPIDRDSLRRCFNAIIARHEVLRTSYVAVDGQPAPVIAPSLAFNLPFMDLSELPETEIRAQLSELVAGCAHWPFNLAEAPLLKALLIRVRPDEHVLLVTTHHIISDGWSIDIFIREMSLLYETFTRDPHTDPLTVLPPLPMQFIDFAAWQGELIESGALASQLSYWQRQLAGSESMRWPTTIARPAKRSFRYGLHTTVLPGALAATLQQLSKQEGVSLFMTFMAALQTMLYGYTGQRDIKVGTIVANRTQVETEALIGCFINAMVVRTRFADDMLLRELLHQVRQTSLEGYAHQDVPEGLLARAVQAEGSPDPLFQVFFIFQNIYVPPLQKQDITITSWSLGEEEPREYEAIPTAHHLWIEIKEELDKLTVVFKYKLDLFDRQTGIAMAEQFIQVLERIAESLDQPLATFLQPRTADIPAASERAESSTQ